MKRLKNKNSKRATDKQICDKKQLDTILEELKKESKTYENNQKILREIKIQNRKKPRSIQILEKLVNMITFCGKCIVYFIIGAIIILIITSILK